MCQTADQAAEALEAEIRAWLATPPDGPPSREEQFRWACAYHEARMLRESETTKGMARMLMDGHIAYVDHDLGLLIEDVANDILFIQEDDPSFSFDDWLDLD